MAKYYNELINIHPFREGNGRTIREFLREFVNYNNKNMPFNDVMLDYSKMDKQSFLLAVQDRYLYPSLLEMEFMKALVKVPDNKISHNK